MKAPKKLLAIIVITAAANGVGRGDTAEMRDGSLVQGKYVGGTAGTVRFETPEGVKVLETGKILALTFAEGGATSQPAGAPAVAAPTAAASAVPAAAAAATTPKTAQVPAGTVLNIKLDGPVSSKDPEGKKFSGKLLADVTANGATVAKSGSAVYGQVDKSKQAGRAVGKSELAFSLSGIDIGGKIQPIVTTGFSVSGKCSARKTARNAAIGAGIGAAADGGDGAGKGAAIGAGVSLIRKGESVTAPAGMILEFRLSQPFEATVTQ
jgi:hypothetical protein